MAFINTAPVVGLLSAETLEATYGVAIASNDMELLMRHRALLFGILGGFVFYSIFKPEYRWAAMVMIGCSLIGFLVLMSLIGDHGPSIQNVRILDLIAVVSLFIAGGLSWQQRKQNQKVDN